MSSQVIGRLFTELGMDTAKFKQSALDAINLANQIGGAVTKTGQVVTATGDTIEKAGVKFVENFKRSLDPAAQLTQQIKLLSAAGISQNVIWDKMGAQLTTAANTSTKFGQALSPEVQRMIDFGKSTTTTGFSIENLGKSITQFATNPMEAMKSGIGGMLEKMGPTAVALGGIATAAIGAGVALFKYAESQSDIVEGLENMSAKTGLSIQTLQALEIITENAGLKGMDLGRIIGKLNEQLGKGSGEFVEAIKRLNLEMTDTVTGKPKDVLQFLDEIRSYLLSIPNEANRTSEAQRILGGRLAELIPLLLNSRDGISSQTKALIEQNVVMNKDTIEAWRKFDVQLDKTHIQVSKFTNIFSGVIAKLGEWALAITDQEAYGAALNGRFAEYAKRAKEGADATGKLTDATAGLRPVITRTVIELSDETKELLEVWAAEDNVIEAKKKHADSIKALYRPMDELAKKLKEEMKYFSQEEVITKHKDEILKAATAQSQLTGEVSDASIEIVRQVDRMNDAEYATGKLNDKLELLRKVAIAAAVDPQAEIIKLGGTLKAVDEKLRTNILATTDWDKINVELFNELNNIFVPQTIEGFGEVDKKIKTAADRSNELGDAFGGAFSRLSSDLATNIIEWKGWGDTIVNLGKDLAHSLLSSFLDGLFTPLTNSMASLGKSLGNILFGGGTGSNSGGIVGTILGSLGIGGKSTGSSTGGIVGTAGGIVGTTAAAGSVGISGLGASLGALASNPITIALAGAAGLAVGIPKLIDAISGPDSWEAMVKEVARDYGGVKIDTKTAQQYSNSFGITESEAWGIRKNITSSPQFLEILYSLAQQQSKTDAFLASLSKMGTSWGTFDFRTPFESGLQSGNWDALNQMWGVTSSLGDAGFGTRTSAGSSKMYLANSFGAGNADFSSAVGSGMVYGGNYASSSPTVVVNVNGNNYGMDELDRKIASSLTRTVQRGGLSFLGARA
jgi:hypothetical protein